MAPIPNALVKEEEFSSETIQAYLKTTVLGQKIHFLPQTDSTQNVATQMAHEDYPDGLVVVTEEQISGHGRSDHTWESPKGVNLYFSLLFRPKDPPLEIQRANQIQFMSAIAVAHTLKETCAVEVELKWPNDLWVKDQKLGGIILTTYSADSKHLDHIIMGMGINLNAEQKHFSEEIKERATSVFLLKGKKVNRPLFFACLLNQLEGIYQDLRKNGFEKIRKDWQSLAPHMTGNAKIKIQNALADPGNQEVKILKGKAKGIDQEGHLLVQDEKGQDLTILDGKIQFPLK